MSKIRPEERFPLLLYFVDNPSGLSKTNKRLYFDKNRFQRINNGASTIFTEWPNYVNTCWVATVLSGLIFFMMLLLVLTSLSTSRPRIPRCVQIDGGSLDNKTVHLIHGPTPWDERELEFLENIIQTFVDFKIHIILIHSPHNFDNIPTTFVTTEPSKSITTSTATVGTTTATTTTRSTTYFNGSTLSNVIEKDLNSSSLSPIHKKLLLNRRRKRNLDKRLTNLHFSIKLGAKRLLDILMHHKKNNSVEEIYSMETTVEPKIKTICDVLEKYPNIFVENTTYREAFYNTPLAVYYNFLSESLKIFSLRVLQLWQYGGISFDLDQGCRKSIKVVVEGNSVTEIVVNPTEMAAVGDEDTNSTVVPVVEFVESTSAPIEKDDYLTNYLTSQYYAYYNLPMGVVTADDHGIHMETKTACHAFFGEIIMTLRKLPNGMSTTRDILRSSLKVFCKHSFADKKYCDTL